MKDPPLIHGEIEILRFLMLTTNASKALGQLLSVRRTPQGFWAANSRN